MSQSGNGLSRDIILLGGSSGAIEAVLQIVKSLPPHFPASVFVVIHTTAQGPGLLPQVLSRAGRMPAIHPDNGDPILPGHIYVAPPDHHLLVAEDDTLRVRRGPRENGHRPAIDSLFRSAAAEGYAPRSIAVLLSGFLDDGSAGLNAVRRRGGISIVQDPADAAARGMPSRAIAYAGADFVLPARDIAAKLTELVRPRGKVVAMKKKPSVPRRNGASKTEQPQISANAFVAYPEEGNGRPSVFSCPECHGVLWEIKEGGSVRYRCRTGHGYSEATLNEELSSAAESALWAAMRALEEKASMARRTADAATGAQRWRNRLLDQAATYAAHAEILRKMILGEPFSPERQPAALPEARERGGQTG